MPVDNGDPVATMQRILAIPQMANGGKLMIPRPRWTHYSREWDSWTSLGANGDGLCCQEPREKKRTVGRWLAADVTAIRLASGGDRARVVPSGGGGRAEQLYAH
ncbi:hypothetical protein NL676_028561 [Syzygium grande]|nr:hypothetical protein NL676_028561 [Syzygium grande]